MLVELLATAAVAWKDRAALVVDGVSVDYSTLWREAQGWAARFARAGVGSGTPVIMQTTRASDLVAAEFGAWLAGAVAVPLDGSQPPARVAAAAKQCGAGAVVVDEPVVEDVRHGDWTVLATGATGTTGPRAGEPTVVVNDAAADALLLYTSGTTGPSKCVRFSHGAMDANVRALVEAMRWRHTDRCLTPVPAALPAVLATCVLPAFAVGATVYVVTDRTPGQLVRSAGRYQPTILFAVPYTFELLCRAEATTRALERIDPLRLCVTSSAPATDELIQRFHRLTGQLLRSMYCSSEAGSVTYVDGPNDRPAPAGSVGRPLPGVRLTVRRPDGTPADVNEAGEIVVSGPLLGSGYVGEPDLTAKVFRSDGVHTGDIGLVDGNGELRLRGRGGDRINHAGYNVDPREVEEVLRTHPGVAAARVESEADALEHQRIVATVVARPGFDLADLTAYSAQRLATYQQPHRIRIADELPATPSKETPHAHA